MIRRRTILILGAGASSPFGFPSGRNLLIHISNHLEAQDNAITQLLLGRGHGFNLLRQFGHELRHSMQPSVDAFLENRREYTDVGKEAIACALIPYEREERLYRDPNSPTWYEYLFTKLAGRSSEFSANRLSVLTFNYDRSFEHSLHLALKNAYGLADDEAAKQLLAVEVIHLHGQLGGLPYLIGGGRPYRHEVTDEAVTVASSGIKVIHENIGKQPQFDRAQELLIEADQIAFLGFGFHPVNVKRLGLERVRRGTLVVGSAYEILAGERPAIKRLLPFDIRLGNERHGVLEFLRDDPFLSVATKPLGPV